MLIFHYSAGLKSICSPISAKSKQDFCWSETVQIVYFVNWFFFGQSQGYTVDRQLIPV